MSDANDHRVVLLPDGANSRRRFLKGSDKIIFSYVEVPELINDDNVRPDLFNKGLNLSGTSGGEVCEHDIPISSSLCLNLYIVRSLQNCATLLSNEASNNPENNVILRVLVSTVQYLMPVPYEPGHGVHQEHRLPNFRTGEQD